MLGIDLSGTNHTIRHNFIDNVYDDFKFISYITPGDIVCGLVCMILLVVFKVMKNSMDGWRAPSAYSPLDFVSRHTLWLVLTARNAVVVIGATLIAFTLSIKGYDYLTLVDKLQPG